MDKGKEIAKALVATITALGTWGATAAADGTYDQVELWGLCGVAVVGLGVWIVPNQTAIRSASKPAWGDGKLTADK